MKRMTALLLAALLCLCLCLAGCGKQQGMEEIPHENPPQETAGTEKEPDRTQQDGGSPAQSNSPAPSGSPAQSGPAQSSPAPSGNTAAQSAETPQQSPDLAGPWHLDSGKNDLAAFADSPDLFPGYGEWGASMEIRSDGQMSWYIGAEGWHGTYTMEDGVLHAQLTSDLEGSARSWDFRISEEKETVMLEMDYKDRTVYWAYGDQEDPAHGGDKG